jgi:hypothetical protein
MLERVPLGLRAAIAEVAARAMVVLGAAGVRQASTRRMGGLARLARPGRRFSHAATSGVTASSLFDSRAWIVTAVATGSRLPRRAPPAPAMSA